MRLPTEEAIRTFGCIMPHYPPYPSQVPQCQTLKPDINKLVWKNAATLIGWISLVSLLFLILHLTGGIDILFAPLEAFGISISTASFVLGFLGISLVVFVGVLAENYLAFGNCRYEFYGDRVVAYRPAWLVLLDSTDVPYDNIVRVFCVHKGLFDTLFSTGTIVMELSGIHQKTLELPLISHSDDMAAFIQRIIQQAHDTRQAEAVEQYRIGKIMGD